MNHIYTYIFCLYFCIFWHISCIFDTYFGIWVYIFSRRPSWCLTQYCRFSAISMSKCSVQKAFVKGKGNFRLLNQIGIVVQFGLSLASIELSCSKIVITFLENIEEYCSQDGNVLLWVFKKPKQNISSALGQYRIPTF